MSSSVLNNQGTKLFWIKNLEPFMAIKVEQITTLLKVKPRTSVHSLFNIFPNHFIKTCTNAVFLFFFKITYFSGGIISNWEYPYIHVVASIKEILTSYRNEGYSNETYIFFFVMFSRII